MEVSSPLTGRRGVSLPFTDFCLPVNGKTNQRQLYEAALDCGRRRRWRYLECRSNDREWPGSIPSLAFYGHVLDLAQPTDLLFKAFDDSVRRAVRKAESAKVKVEFSGTLESIRTFYSLHCLTRQRHGLPPQPFRFFKNIAQHILQTGKGFVATSYSDSIPVASSIFFHERRQAIFKFGASDFASQHLRPNHLLMWESIKKCAALGFHQLHFGRTSFANDGLRRFKKSFGAREERIESFKYDFSKSAFVADVDRTETWMNGIFSRLPLPLLRLSGQILYPHLS